MERAEFSERAGYDAARSLLGAHPEITAVYTSSFDQAAGTLRALADLDRAVPREVSVLSFEDVPQADFTVPRLSTIGMPMHELGEMSVEVLLEQIRGAPPRVHAMPTDPKLVDRGSTRRLGPTR